MRTRKKPWSSAELKTNQKIVHASESWKGYWQKYFNNNFPITLEIGCGKGRFITSMAASNPEKNFIALERDSTILAMAARRSMQTLPNTNNLAFIVSRVEELTELFAPGEIKTLYIQFCDPWSNKKKWAKRRLTHSRFLDMYRQLKIEEIFFKTDNRMLFEFSIEQFSARLWQLENISLDLYAQTPFDPYSMTEYEEKFMLTGAPIYKLEARDKILEVLINERKIY